MLQTTTEPVEPSDNEAVPFPQSFQASFKAGPVVAFAGSLIDVDVALINTGSHERILLQIRRLISSRDAGVADEHGALDHARWAVTSELPSDRTGSVAKVQTDTPDAT